MQTTPTTPNPSMTTPDHLLRASFAAGRAQGLRAREAAARLNVSEGEVMAAHAVGQMNPQEEAASLYSVTVLDGDWLALLHGLEGVGPVMALTRNEAVVHEKTGVYRHASAHGLVGMVLGPEIDLRLFFSHWHVGMHVVEHDPERGDLHSLQFFDAHGQALHKIHARPHTDLQALETLVQQHARPEARPVFMPAALSQPADLPDVQIDVAGLGQAWSAMRDTHEFYDLLKRFKVSRTQSLRLMEGVHTRRTPLMAVEWLLHSAALHALPIMVFAGNAGCLQIHTGPVEHVERMGPWLNVMDVGFNLHVRTEAIAESWLVSKPTADGEVTSIELFDAQGGLLAMFFGERKPGKPELPAWRMLAQGLTSPERAQAAVADSKVAA